jgi:hypothetical protein
MTRYKGSGWHKQSIRHSNARKYGKAGGKYLTMQDKRNIKNFKIIARKNHLYYTCLLIPNHQRIRGVYDETTDMISLPHNSFDDLLAHEITHAIDYKKTGETKHDKEFHEINQEILLEIPSNQKV